MRLITSAQQRALDALAAEGYGLPTRVLMETAGAAMARHALMLLGPKGRVAVVCGSGNNGGDGYVAARFLREAGVLATCAWARDPLELKGIAREAYDAYAAPFRRLAERAGRGAGDGVAPVERGELWQLARAFPGSVIVDAVFGTGLSRAPEGDAARAIEAIHKARIAGAIVLSVDVPSGLDADTGALYPAHVEADVTVTFGWPKRGLHLFPGAGVAGRVVVEPLGLGPELASEVFGDGPSCELVEEKDVLATLPPRPRTAHKNDFGHVLVVAGSPGKSGAAQLVALGALKAGAGLVTLAARADVLAAAMAGLPELMGLALPGDGALGMNDLAPLAAALRGKTALAMGPGIARGPETADLIAALLANLEPGAAAVLDADALNALADEPHRIGERLRRATTPPLLTPHPGEFSRMTGEPVEQLESDRLGAAARWAQLWNAHVLLKGARTVIASPEGSLGVNPTGNAGMATAGAGDVLTGIAAALLARRGGAGGVAERARAAAYVHGLAGDYAAKAHGEAGLTASDVARALSEVWRAWGR